MSQKSKRPFQHRRLMMEPLESRSLLAGDITASVTNGVLTIQGDDAGNGIRVQQMTQTYTGAWPGAKLQIAGTPFAGSATTVNGGTGWIVLEGIKNGVTIDLGGGKNKLFVGNFDGGPGVADRKIVSLPGNVTITGGADNDDIKLYAENYTKVSVNPGEAVTNGGDKVFIGNSLLYQLDVQMGRTWQGMIDGTSIKGAATIKAGDAVGSGGGEFIIQGNTKFDSSLDITMRRGNVTFKKFGTNANWYPTLNGTTKMNFLFGGRLGLSGNINGPFTAKFGGAQDSLDCDGLYSKTVLNVALEGGDDFAAFNDVSLAGINLDGGTGSDRVGFGGGSIQLGQHTFTNFEHGPGP